MLAILLSATGAARAYVPVPLSLSQNDTLYNLGSRQGVPISTVPGSPSGSDGRLPVGLNGSGTYNVATLGQFQSAMVFGAAPSATNYTVVRDSALLNGGTAFSGAVAAVMQRPCGYSNGAVAIVLRQAQVGALYMSQPVSLLFGSPISVPLTDYKGNLLTNVLKTSYWQEEPYTFPNQTNNGYYWSPHARAAYAIQAGPIRVTWLARQVFTTETMPLGYVNQNGPQSFLTNGGSIYLLYTVTYVASGSSVKPPQKMYWTERAFRLTGKPITVPASRVGSINIVYNPNFPRTVAEEYQGPGSTSITDGTTNTVLSELRTLWYDQSLGSIYAYNYEGRVFVELLGDLNPDGQTRQPLGYEIVDVAKQPVPQSVATPLGERILPSDATDLSLLAPSPLTGMAGLDFAYTHYRAGNSVPELYATRETRNLNDYSVFWMTPGVAGLQWPDQFVRYRLYWPAEVGSYSHYLRTPVDTEVQAAATAVQLSSQDIPSIAYQEPLDHPRAKITDDFRFYTYLDASQPAHRTLLQFLSGDNVGYERVFSWLDANLKATNLDNTVAATLSDVSEFYNSSAAHIAYTNYLAENAAYEAKYAPYGAYLQALAGWETRYSAYTNYLALKAAYESQLAAHTAYTNWQARHTAYTNYLALKAAYDSQLAAHTAYTNWQARHTAYTNYVAYTNRLAAYTAYTNWQARFAAYTNYLGQNAAYTNQFR